MVKVKKGLDLPISGLPAQKIYNAPIVTEVAVTGPDFNGMKPTMIVKEGDRVKVGDPLFECKKTAGVIYTSPACGTVKAINRGERRVLQTVVIEVEGQEQKAFSKYSQKELTDYKSEEIRELLIESGQWVGLRTRPYSKVPAIDSSPASIFVNTMDTNPLAADTELIASEYSDDYIAGVQILSQLCPKVFISKKAGAKMPEVKPLKDSDIIDTHEFSGPHPAGLVGTHIHNIDPVNFKKTVWHIGLQDAIAIGHFFRTGNIFVERIVSFAGPMAHNPRLLRTRLGACINQLIEGELEGSSVRIISGSILNGRKVDDNFCFLGRYNTQITAIEENSDREFLGWQGPGYDKYSIKNTFAGKFKNKVFAFHTNTYGSRRAIVPVGSFEQVMPLDILPTQLIKALKTQDVELAQSLGALELDEEDLALCTFASPGKDDFGPDLRQTLTTIEKEG